MTVLDRKLIRDLVQSRGMLAAVIAIIAAGTASLVGMLSTYNNLEVARDSYYSHCRMADFWIDLKKAPVEEVERLGSLPGISEIRQRITFPVVVDLEGVEKPISGLVVSMPDKQEPVINNIVVLTGSYFTPGHRDEVIVSEKFAEARGIHPGSFIHLVMKGQKKKMFVTGTGISSEFVFLSPPGSIVEDPAAYGAFFIKRSYAEDVFGFHGACNSVVGLLTPQARRNPGPVLDEIGRRLDPYGVFATTPRALQTSNLALSAEMSGCQTMAAMFPVLFLGMAALVLNVLMTRMAEQQRVVIGTFKALGYYNVQLLDHFLKFGLFVGVLGGILGCWLGYWIAGAMTMMYQGFFEFPDLVNQAYPPTMVMAVAISVVFAVLGTIRGVRRVVRLSPAEAMHEGMPAAGGSILLEKWKLVWARLGFWWQMVFRGLFRNKARTCVGIAAAATGSALVVLAFGFMNSMDYMIDFEFGKVLKADYELDFRHEVDGGALYEARRLPGVTRAEPLFDVACTFYHDNHHKKEAITGVVRGATMTVPRDVYGNVVEVPPTGLVMAKRLAAKLGLSAGDTVRFVPVKGEKIPYEVPVVRLVTSVIGMGVYADYDYLNRLIGESSAISRVQLKAQQTPAEKASFFKDLKRMPALQSVDVMADEKAAVTKQDLGAMQGMAVVMIIFAGVIFFGSILNGSLITLAERRREIATFRVLGFQPREIGGMFIRENLLMNITGAVLGLPLGYLLLLGMATQFTNDAYIMLAIIYPSTWLWTMALSLLFVLCAHLIVQRNINRLHWEEALAMKE